MPPGIRNDAGIGFGVGDGVGVTVGVGRVGIPVTTGTNGGWYHRHASIDTIPNTMNRTARLIIQVFYQIGTILSVFSLCVYVTLPRVHAVRAIDQMITAYGFWFSLSRELQVEVLYFGQPGVSHASMPIAFFRVKTGIPNERPTPVPQLVGRPYWFITAKYPTDNPETAPYFLELDVPVSEGSPYGPVPYPECGGGCDWVLPGAFGLHGVNGDVSKLGADTPGSSGCVRHTDRDIRALYSLLDPENLEIRYYIQNDTEILSTLRMI